MERLTNSNINVLYNKNLWKRRGLKNLVIFMGIMLTDMLAMILFTRILLNYNLNANAIIITGIVIIALSKGTNRLFNFIVLGKNVHTFELIDFISGIKDVALRLERDKLFIYYKSLGIKRKVEIEKLLHRLHCNYVLKYIKRESGDISIDIDTVSFEYIRIDIII